MPVIPTLGRLRQDHQQFKGNLGYIVRPCAKKREGGRNKTKQYILSESKGVRLQGNKRKVAWDVCWEHMKKPVLACGWPAFVLTCSEIFWKAKSLGKDNTNWFKEHFAFSSSCQVWPDVQEAERQLICRGAKAPNAAATARPPAAAWGS